jgi:5-formyltetrahydrofolate cyclo-ligase
LFRTVLASIGECLRNELLHKRRKIQKLKNNKNEDKTNLLLLKRNDWRNKENMIGINVKKDVD